MSSYGGGGKGGERMIEGCDEVWVLVTMADEGCHDNLMMLAMVVPFRKSGGEDASDDGCAYFLKIYCCDLRNNIYLYKI